MFESYVKKEFRLLLYSLQLVNQDSIDFLLFRLFKIGFSSILSVYTVWDGLSLKTISRYYPLKKV